VRCKLKGDFITKVRVSEETSNLSHTSNLISSIGLENSSPSLMRSIRVEGRTHSWVVHSSFGEQEKREVELEKRQHLQSWACIPRQQASMSFKVEYNIECSPYGMDF
jgi:hypothetical protein